MSDKIDEAYLAWEEEGDKTRESSYQNDPHTKASAFRAGAECQRKLDLDAVGEPRDGVRGIRFYSMQDEQFMVERLKQIVARISGAAEPQVERPREATGLAREGEE